MLARLLLPAVLLALCATSVSTSAALKLRFVNENLEHSDSNVYVMFRKGTTNAFDASYSGGAIALTTAYSFAQLSGGVMLTDIVAGVFYVSLGNPMSVPVTNVAGQLPGPSPSNTTDADYSTRWDSVEITFTGKPYDAADLTGINMFGIPFVLRTYSGPTILQTLGYNVGAATMIATLRAAATNDAAVLTDASNRFLRVLGPTAYAAGTIGPYQPLGVYIDVVRASGRPILISDLFSGPAGPQPPRLTTQRYQFSTSFTNLLGVDQLIMTGGSLTAGGIGITNIVTFAYSNIAYQVYANNPLYTINGADSGSMADNDVYAAAVRDVFAGFACGFIGCAATDQVTGLAFQSEASSNWFATVQTQAFSDVQTVLPYYNGYGEAFWRYSDVYGFPFADRLSSAVQANLNPAVVDTLEITALPDVIVPEPAGVLAVFIGAGLSAARRRSHRA
jgi:hypothetical protein